MPDPFSDTVTPHNVFAGNPLHRAANERKDEAWVRTQMDHPGARVLPLWRLRVPLARHSAPTLGWGDAALRDAAPQDATLVLLGLRDGLPHLALDVSSLDDPAPALGLDPATDFADARAAAPDLPPAEAGILAQARSLLDWHASHSFCPNCGAPTESCQGGAMRVCVRCHHQHFPRTNPVVITLVHAGDRCLLAARAGMDPPRFTCVAGFVDQGETIEEAVRREIMEETGITVGAVRYHASQPWPFPSNLMIGCFADPLSCDIQVDEDEIGEARWFPRPDVRAALAACRGDAQGEPPFHLPPPLAIAYTLIDHWAHNID